MPSIPSLLNFAGNLLSQIPLGGFQYNPAKTVYNTPLTNGPTCPADSPLSCHNSTAAPDSCCFIYPGGQLLLTQFWDTNPTVGPVDSWTLHGLWYVSLFVSISGGSWALVLSGCLALDLGSSLLAL